LFKRNVAVALRTLQYAVLIAYAVITFIPFLWALSASFKTLAEISTGLPNFIPKQFTLDNYRQIFLNEPLFLRWLGNSTFVSVLIMGLNLLFNSMAGYALARIPFPGNKALFYIVLAVLMIPGQLTLIPSYLILNEFGWLNSYQGLIVPGAANATFIFMMRQFFLSFPKELEEAAAIDGLTRLGTFLRIALPLAGPPLAAQAIFIFMGAWNDFLKPLVIMSEKEMFTLPLGLNTFKGQYISFWNLIMAASMVFTLPVLVLFAFFNRFFVKGITFTGGK
jgi:ABC-type sugar transport system, permease component